MKLAIAIIMISISGFMASTCAQEEEPNGPLKIYSRITQDPSVESGDVFLVNTDTLAVEHEGLAQGTYALYNTFPPMIILSRDNVAFWSLGNLEVTTGTTTEELPINNILDVNKIEELPNGIEYYLGGGTLNYVSIGDLSWDDCRGLVSLTNNTAGLQEGKISIECNP